MPDSRWFNLIAFETPAHVCFWNVTFVYYCLHTGCKASSWSVLNLTKVFCPIMPIDDWGDFSICQKTRERACWRLFNSWHIIVWHQDCYQLHTGGSCCSMFNLRQQIWRLQFDMISSHCIIVPDTCRLQPSSMCPLHSNISKLIFCFEMTGPVQRLYTGKTLVQSCLSLISPGHGRHGPAILVWSNPRISNRETKIILKYAEPSRLILEVWSRLCQGEIS